MFIYVQALKDRVGVVCTRPCVEVGASVGWGGGSEQIGEGKEVVVALTHVLSLVKFECLGDLRNWDGGVVPKKHWRSCDRTRCCWSIYEGLGGGGDVLRVEEGKLCVKVSNGAFP